MDRIVLKLADSNELKGLLLLYLHCAYRNTILAFEMNADRQGCLVDQTATVAKNVIITSEIEGAWKYISQPRC